MKSGSGWLALAVLLVTPATAISAAESGSADARLRSLYDREWAWRKEQLLVDDTDRAEDTPARLPKVDAVSQQARLAYWTDVLAELNQIPEQQLSEEERINAAVFRHLVETSIDDVRFRTYEAPFNSDTFFWTSFTPRQGLGSEAEYRTYLERLSDVPRYFSEHIANMRAGLARGFTVPRVSVIGRDRTIEPYVRSDDRNPLFLPFTQLPVAIPAPRQAQLQAEARTLIERRVAPAYAELLSFMREEYLPRARTAISASSLPDGEAYYRAMILRFTTLDRSPEEIHQLGLAEVARIKQDMLATMREAGYEGTLAEFMEYLETDPQFYAKTPRELLAAAAYISKKADLELKNTIGFLPRTRHGILPVPEALAPIYTGGRGGIESCLINTYNLPARPLYTLPALVLHECTPGHSFQGALALEGPERPPFRRHAYLSGYSEGWGLYTEWLGTVMGIYETPYEEFGRQTYEMWRAVRLVVDTGIHRYGWSRERALDYMNEHLALSEHEVTTEVDRYIAWPGQALSYKLGELQIRRHRKEAQEALGAKFDQRKFHDAILALGSVPLPVLESRMAEFIASGGEQAPAAVTGGAP